MKKGDLVKAKYNLEDQYGIIISNAEWHPKSYNSPITLQYIWVLWDDGKTELYKTDMLEVINENRGFG